MIMKTKINCVLLIDDDEPTNYFNSLILEETGCVDHIQVAQSGQRALEYLDKCCNSHGKCNGCPCPDLILLDINMPAMNGWEFLERYRKMNKHHKCRSIFVMLTTSLFSEDVLKAKQISEISGFENKPLTAEAIHKILEKYFAANEANAERSAKKAFIPQLPVFVNKSGQQPRR
jgi:CheY-like chemotaxis protein